MSEKLIAKVGGVDMSAQFKSLALSPNGPFVIGRGDVTFEKKAGGLTITSMMPVQVYFAFNAAGAGIAPRGRLFSGFVARRVTGQIVTTKGWSLSCQDMNILLDALVRDAAPAYTVTITAGDFASQIAQVVQIIQRNGSGSVNITIDSSSYVANLVTSTMPALSLDPGHALRYYIQKVCDSAVAITPALKPRFYIGTSDTFGATDVFGVPCLRLWDAALTPTADWTYDIEGSVYGDPKRSLDGTQLTQRQQSIYGEGFVATYAETASQAPYPNPYINHGVGAGGNSGYWMREPLKDSRSGNLTQALAALTKTVQAKAYPRETINFSVYDRVRPGDVIDLSWTLEGISHEIKRVMGVTYAYEEVGVIYATLTVNARKLQLFDTGDEGVDAAPTEGDVVRPNPPTAVVANASLGVYDPTSGFTVQPVSWTASTSSDAAGNRIYVTQGTYHTMSPVPDNSVTSATVLLRPGEAYSIEMAAYDSASPPNESAHTTPPVTGIAAEPDPSATLYNPGYETASPWDSTQADGWLKTVGGGGVVTRDLTTKRTGRASIKLDSSSGVGGTSSSVKGRYMRAQEGVRHRIAVWAKAAFAGDFLTLKVHWYTPALVFISTTTLVTNAALTTTWQQFAYAPIGPAGTGAMKVEPLNGVAGGQAIWVDDWDVVINPPTPTFYNGSFEIRAPGTALPDGYTFVGDATPALSNIHVRDGSVAYLITQGTGQTLTTTSTPMVAAEGHYYNVILSIFWDTATVNGTDFNLVWRDSSNAAIGSPVLIVNRFGGSTSVFLDSNKGPYLAPAGTASVELQMVTNAPSGGVTNTWIDRLDIVPTPLEAQNDAGITKGRTTVDSATDTVLNTITGTGGGKVTSANGYTIDSALALTTLAISVWPYTAVASASVIDGTTGATNRTLNLPAVASCAGRLYLIKKVDSGVGTITIDPNSTETIDGASTLVLSSQYSSVLIQSNGTEWKVRSYYRGGVSPNVTATAPIKTTTTGDNVDISILAATTGAAGSMSAADKTKLDSVASSASVSSVALTVPSEFSVSGSPITISGTLAITKANQSANLFYMGPSSGGAAAPMFRAPVAADLPIAALRAGPTFPTSPAPSNNDYWYKTDLGVMCRYISAISSWVGPPIYMDLMKADTAPVYSATAITPFLVTPPDSASYYLERVSWRLLVATTNNISNYWTYRIGCSDFSLGGTGLLDVNSSAKTAGTRFMLEGTGLPYQPLNFTDGNQLYIWIEIRKDNGAPGNTTVYGCHLTMYRVYT